MVKALAHACLFSSDLERTLRFYCDGLGLRLQFRFMRRGELFGFYLKIAEGQFLEFFRRDEAPGGVPPIGHVCLEVDDLAALRTHLHGLGYEAGEPKLGSDKSWQMWTKDPDGTAIELHQYTPESAQFTGSDCEVTWC